MFLPLITALAAAGSAFAVNNSAWKNPTLEPTPVMGQDPSTLALYGGAIVGTVAPFLGMPFLSAPAFGVAAGAYAARDGLKRTKTAFQEFLEDRLMGPPAGAADAAAGGGSRPFRVFSGGDAGDFEDLGQNAPATLAERLAS